MIQLDLMFSGSVTVMLMGLLVIFIKDADGRVAGKVGYSNNYYSGKNIEYKSYICLYHLNNIKYTFRLFVFFFFWFEYCVGIQRILFMFTHHSRTLKFIVSFCFDNLCIHCCFKRNRVCKSFLNTLYPKVFRNTIIVQWAGWRRVLLMYNCSQ